MKCNKNLFYSVSKLGLALLSDLGFLLKPSHI